MTEYVVWHRYLFLAILGTSRPCSLRRKQVLLGHISREYKRVHSVGPVRVVFRGSLSAIMLKSLHCQTSHQNSTMDYVLPDVLVLALKSAKTLT